MCMNLNHSKTQFFKRVSLVFASLFSILAASPLPFFMEIVPFHSSRYGVTGVRCGTSPKGNTLARNIYFILVGVFAVATGSTFITLYSKIAYKIFVHFKISSNQNNKKVKEINEEANYREKNDASDYKENQEHSTVRDHQMNPREKSSKTRQIPMISKQTGSSKRRKKDRGITYRMTIMFFVITLLFFICYIPKLILIIIFGIYKNFSENLSTSQRSAAMFVYEMFIINNIVNPFIYAFMDTKFRIEATTLLKRAFNC
ncbi:unnamed protein product [Mytilus coruscus]|uniref:G-protein coupled receptors family 1 profile domain-containing protein n=1 Tax=Mytilus coruscus TaxID=42192 RepID=A0A6J7ZU60_MYTCO|nr:unnamed protein product [Mytilus coruscus]